MILVTNFEVSASSSCTGSSFQIWQWSGYSCRIISLFLYPGRAISLLHCLENNLSSVNIRNRLKYKIDNQKVIKICHAGLCTFMMVKDSQFRFKKTVFIITSIQH